MKNKKNTEMWKNALAQIDEKYIAEAAEFAPEPKNTVSRATKEKSGTGNLGFVFAAAAAVIVSFIGVGFFFNGTGIEPLSPSSEGTVGSSTPVVTTVAIENNGEITTSIITETTASITEITTVTYPVNAESYQNWFAEAEQLKESYSQKIEETENYIADLEKLIADLEKKLETEKFEQQSDYDMVKANLEMESARLTQLKVELEMLKADYYEQVLLIENNRKTFEELYPSTVETKQPLTMEKLKALVSAKGKELTWSDFEQFEGEDVGSGLYIMEYPINELFTLIVGGVPSEKPMYINLVAGNINVFSITDNGADGFEEFIEGFSPFELLGDYYEGEDGLFHVSGENWTVCSDYDLFREYFFGVWGEDYIIDDSEKDWVAASRSMYFDNFYKVNDNILAVVYGGTAGGELRWLDMRNPDVLYEAYGTIGDSPYGFSKNKDGMPEAFARNKTSDETNEPENGYLSVYRIRELAKEYGIEPSLITDFEMQTENGKQYHDSKYYFYPMYLVEKTDNRFVIATQIENTESIYFSGSCTFVTVSFWKNNGQWERKINRDIGPADCTLHIVYDEKNPEKIKEYEYNNDISISVIVPEGVTSIADGVFEDCKQLESVILPSTLKTIGKNAFKNCNNLSIITIPYGVTTIGEGAFENCTSLPATLTLPDTVTIIDGAFKGCTQFDGTCKPIPIKHGTEDFTLIRPSDSTFITTQYSEGEEGHDGIDYAGKLGDNIYAAADGVVIGVAGAADDETGYGIHITIKHEHNGQELYTFYAHLNEVIVKEGDKVSQGDVIGYMGSTGWATGPHVHFSLFADGIALNPRLYFSKPISLTSPVSNDSILYGYEEYEGHKGIDYSGEKGQNISAAAEGTVSLAEWNGQYGNCVIIDHLNGYQTLYAHLDEIRVKAGDAVTAGQIIGTMGSTGLTTGTQLHFELLKDSETLNPEDYMIK